MPDSSTEILPCITEIANQIFQQQALPASHITTSGKTTTLDIDIPVSQLLVFAQGRGSRWSCWSWTSPSSPPRPTPWRSPRPTPLWAGRARPSWPTGCAALAQTYAAGDTPYAKGTYTLTVSDPSHVEIYYIAGTDIDCHLTYNGVEVKDDEKDYAGEYGITMRFLNPLTGEEVTSDLLDGAAFTAELVNGGEVQTIDSSTTSVNLKEGEVELNASARVPARPCDRVQQPHLHRLSGAHPAGRAPPRSPGTISSPPGPDAEPILVTVTNFDTGRES